MPDLLTPSGVAGLPRRSLAFAPRLWRALDPQLPRTLWFYEAGVVVNAFGRGMTLPFVLIYLHNVRGFGLGVAGLVAAAYAAAAFVGSLIGGSLADRAGARLVLIGSLVAAGGGYGWFGFAHHPLIAFAAITVAGAGNGAFLPAQSSTVAALAGQEHRHGAFAVQRAADNLGLGLGATVGGAIAVTSNPDTFTALFVLDAATSLLFALLLTLLPLRPAAAPAPTGAQPDAPAASARYRDVFRQRLVLGVVAVNALFVVGGYTLLETALPLFAKNAASVSEHGIGLIFLVNTVSVVALQLPVMRMLEGRRRLGALALVGVGWAALWSAVLFSGVWLNGSAALGVFLVVVASFAAGECVLALVSALVADLAPAELRGRCMSLIPCSYAAGFTVGPALAGITMQVSQYAIWPLGGALLVAAAGAALQLERRLPDELRLTPVRARPAQRGELREAAAVA